MEFAEISPDILSITLFTRQISLYKSLFINDLEPRRFEPTTC
jgi:hypothetical protein